MPIPHEACRAGLVTVVLTLAALGLTVSNAMAGQPWNCLCQGKPQRFIASTYKCERDLNRYTGKPVAEGFKLLVKPCTKTEFEKWQANACKLEGCRPPH